MTSLIAAAVESATPSLDATPVTTRRLVLVPVPEVGRPSAAPQAQPTLTALSRVRGGMYSSTVDLIRFADGSTAHTDLIRLNPNIDAYSLDFAGVSPRQLCPTTPSSTCRRSAATCPTCSRPRTPHPPRRRTRSPSTWTPPSRWPRTART